MMNDGQIDEQIWDEQVVEYCRKIIIANLKSQDRDFAEEIHQVQVSDTSLLDHCYGIGSLMAKCIRILEDKGVSLDD